MFEGIKIIFILYVVKISLTVFKSSDIHFCTTLDVILLLLLFSLCPDFAFYCSFVVVSQPNLHYNLWLFIDVCLSAQNMFL